MRPDLLRQTNKLTACFASWSTFNDQQLKHMIEFIQSTLHWRLYGWTGNDDEKDKHPNLFSDARHADAI